ncbi:MAG: OmpA family protein [Polyangiaceae bacterium]
MMKNVLAELDDSSLLAGDVERAPVVAAKGRPKSARAKSVPSPSGGAAAPAALPMRDSEEYESEVAQRSNSGGQGNLTQLSQSLARTRGQILVEGYAKKEDSDKMAASLDRANRAREALIKNGIPPERVVALGRGEQPGKLGGVRIVEVEGARGSAPDGQAQGAPAAKNPESAEPIGTSHFESDSPMTVPRGTSAMVSILNADAEGEVVYLYDPESQRGNEQFPFRSVRLKNPTTSALESGPVTVFGDGRFIGEGLSEPIPARAQAFIPFALDRQIVVERKTSTEDRIRRVITIQRGVFHSELEHRQRVHHTLYNRLGEKTRVYVKHTVPAGYTLAAGTKSSARLGEAHLFQVDSSRGQKRNSSSKRRPPCSRPQTFVLPMEWGSFVPIWPQHPPKVASDNAWTSY